MGSSALAVTAWQPDPGRLWFGSDCSPAFGPAVPLLALPGLLCSEGQAVPAARALSAQCGLQERVAVFCAAGRGPLW